MLSMLLLVAAGTHATTMDGPRSPVLYVRTAEDWAPLRSGSVAGEVVPFTSRSSRVPGAAPTSRGIGFRLWAGTVPIDALDRIEVFAIEHPFGDQVLEGGAGRLTRVRLPSAVRSDSQGGLDLLPQLAFQDGVSIPKQDLCIPELDALAEGFEGWGFPAELVLEQPVPAAGASTAGAGTWRGRSAAQPLRSFDAPSIDQLVIARWEAVPVSQLVPLRLREAHLTSAGLRGWSPWRGQGPLWPDVEEPARAGEPITAALAARDDLRVGSDELGLIEAWFEAPPAAREGNTWTLLVSVWGSGAWPPPPDAPRAPARPRSGTFVDVAHDAGIDMVHFEGPDLQLDIRPTMGPGAAWGDADGDGWVDLFLPQGAGREGSAPPTSRFFRNVEGRRFADESEQRGLALTGAGMGALFYDADGDGDLDLFVANYGRNRFLLNDGTGKFQDASASVGLESDQWHAAVSAADYDRDGDLDLYVTSYLRYDLAQMASGEELGRYQREDPVEMLPFAFPGERKLLLRCEQRTVRDAAAGAPDVALRYVDVARQLGVDDPGGRGMQALWWDFDRDGDDDLYLANDVSPNRFWRNEGDGTFKDIGFSTGLDDPRGCMGLSAADVDGDLDEDLFVTNWQLETNALYVNNLRHTSTKSRVSTFRDRAVEAGVAAPSAGLTGWGCELADFDLDGDLDLFYANGYTSPDYETTGICVGQPCHWFEGDGAGKFTPAFERAGPDVAVPLPARAASACDWDQDGDLDLVVTANNARVRLLRNELERGQRHWLGLRLRGNGGNTRAIGAQVVVEAGGRKLLRSLRAGTGYLSGNAPELHFGLGEAARVDACTVRWPSGRESTHAIEAVDRFVTLAEPR